MSEMPSFGHMTAPLYLELPMRPQHTAKTQHTEGSIHPLHHPEDLLQRYVTASPTNNEAPSIGLMFSWQNRRNLKPCLSCRKSGDIISGLSVERMDMEAWLRHVESLSHRECRYGRVVQRTEGAPPHGYSQWENSMN